MNLKPYEFWTSRTWYRSECRKIDADMRSLRRRVFWHRYKLSIVGFSALTLVILILGILMGVR